MEVSVSDNGVGIPEENLSKISDPFFTTKPPGRRSWAGAFCYLYHCGRAQRAHRCYLKAGLRNYI